MNDKSLMPCPFCGGNDFKIYSTFYFIITCNNCLTDGPSGKNEIDVREKWNNRKTDEKNQAKIQELKEFLANMKEDEIIGTSKDLHDKIEEYLEALSNIQ